MIEGQADLIHKSTANSAAGESTMGPFNPSTFNPILRSRIREGQQPSIVANALSHFYGEGDLKKQVLYDNNLIAYPGEILIMTGPSGSGKTTLLTLIGTLRRVQQGGLDVLGHPLNGAKSVELMRLRQRIGFIFQAHNLFDSLTAVQNVRMALEIIPDGKSLAEKTALASQMLQAVGLGHRLNYRPRQLSGGQKQRVAIARGLVHSPRLVLADEPTAALDEESGRTVVRLLQKLAKEQQTTIIIVTHDNRILDVADRIVSLVDGKIRSDVLIQETAIVSQMLANCKVFERVTPRTLSKVIDEMKVESREAGDMIIRQGDLGDKFYLVRKGSVAVKKSGQSASDVTEVAELHEGDFFGETALLTGQPRNATIIANEDTTLYTLSKESFQAVLADSASLADEIRNSVFVR